MTLLSHLSFSLQVSHGKIIEGGKLKVVCPAGSAGEGPGVLGICSIPRPNLAQDIQNKETSIH